MRRSVLVPIALITAFALFAGPSVLAQWRPGGQQRIVLLVDSSTAVAPMITSFRAGLKDFLDALPGDPEIAIITTGGQFRNRVGPTTDRDKLVAAASMFASDGGANSFLDTMIEADRRLLKSAPERRPVFVILTTDAGEMVGEVNIETYNRFAGDFLKRGGRAHALVVRGVRTGVTTRIAENLAQNTGGYYETAGLASAVPKLMKTMAEYVAADQ